MSNQTEHETLRDLAKRFFKKDDPTIDEIANLDSRIRQIGRLLAAEDGLEEETARKMAIESIEYGLSARFANGMSEMRELHARWIKEACLTKHNEKGAVITANEVFQFAKDKYSYGANDARGIGDSMGRGSGKGLYLEPLKLPGVPRAYRIPDPDKFAGWYQGSDLLPRSYYSDKYWAKLIALESVSKSARFFSRSGNPENAL